MSDSNAARKSLSIGQIRIARQIWPNLTPLQRQHLKALVQRHELSVSAGDLHMLDGKLYVTHSGLLRLACRNRCKGVNVELVPDFCNGGCLTMGFQGNSIQVGQLQGICWLWRR
jgi:hypothetical protein